MRQSLFLICFLTLPAPMLAQSSANPQVEEVRKTSKIHVGPFYVTPGVQLKHFGVDTNVFNAQGDQKSDFMFNLSPKVDVSVAVARRAMFTTTVATDMVWYATYDTERSVDPQVMFRGEGYLHRLTVFAENAFLNTRQRQNFEIDLRSRHIENNLKAGVALRLTSKFSIEAAARRFDTSYDADAQFDGTSLQRTLNRKTTGGELTVRHRSTPLTTLAVRYDNLRDRFEFSPSRDSNSYRIMPGVEFKPRALISGTAYVGYRRFSALNKAVLPEFSGVVAQLGLSYTLLGATTFGVSYRRDLTYSYEEAQPFFIDNAVGASIRQALGRRFDVIVSADRHRYDYQDLRAGVAEVGFVPEEPRIDTTWTYAGSLGYRIRRDARIGFGVSYRQRNSTTKRFRDYDNFRIGTTATYGF